jgi:hypothetical protein
VSPAGALALAMLVVLSGSAGAETQKREQPKGSGFAAIAQHKAGTEFGWTTGRRTAREAGADALKQCGHPRCEVVITVQNACAALVRGPKVSVARKGVSRQDAEAKSLSRCGPGCEVVAWVCSS